MSERAELERQGVEWEGRVEETADMQEGQGAEQEGG